jgi:hypothetical protein
MSKQYTPKDLELPDDEPMVIIRKSFLWICDGDKYAAAALNMYVHWTKWIMKHRPVAQEINRQLKKQGRKASQDTSLILYRKQKDLVKDMLNFCNEKRLRQANEFLESKGLLRIDATPRSNLDHVLKYELQIDVFKKCMESWRTHREEEGNLENDAEMVEVALEADLSETDNSPSRNGQKSASKRTNVGLEADNSPFLNRNIDNNNRNNKIDDEKREDSLQASQQKNSSSPSSQSSLQSSSEKNLSPEVIEILNWWDEIRKGKVPRSDKQKKAAKELADIDAAKENIQVVEQFCLEDNPEWYAVHGIDLQSISNNWGKWQTAQEHKGKAVSLSHTATRVVSSSDDEDYIDDTFYSVKVTDAEVAEEVRETSRIYQDIENFEMHLQSIERFKNDFSLDNYDLCDKIINARRMASSDQCAIDDFFYELRRMVM